MQSFNSQLHIYDEQLKRGFMSLRFAQPLEREFRNFLDSRNVVKQRGALIVGILLLLCFAPLDLRFLDEEASRFYIMTRLYVSVPLLSVALVINFYFQRRFQKYFALFSFLIIAFIGLTAIGTIIYAQNDNQYLPHEGIMLVIMVAFFLGGMRFRQAIACATLIGLTYLILCELYLLPDPYRFHRYLLMFATSLIGGVGAYTLEYQQRISFLQRGALRNLAKTDPLTGLYNRGAINKTLDDLLGYAYREKKAVTLLLLDVDYFKNFNDLYGHLEGDKCLKEVADSLSSHCKRPLDFAGRYGGEEFLILWFDTNADEVSSLAERVRDHIRALRIPHQGSEVSELLTISAGVIHGTPHQKGMSEKFIQQADQCLYRAKASGRNRILIQDLGDENNIAYSIK